MGHCPHTPPTSQDSSHTGQFCFPESPVECVSVVCALLSLAWASAHAYPTPVIGVTSETKLRRQVLRKPSLTPRQLAVMGPRPGTV